MKFLLKRVQMTVWPEFYGCLECDSKEIERLNQKGWKQEHLFPFFGGYPYHCNECGSEHVLFIGSKPPKMEHGFHLSTK